MGFCLKQLSVVNTNFGKLFRPPKDRLQKPNEKAPHSLLVPKAQYQLTGDTETFDFLKIFYKPGSFWALHKSPLPVNSQIRLTECESIGHKSLFLSILPHLTSVDIQGNSYFSTVTLERFSKCQQHSITGSRWRRSSVDFQLFHSWNRV